MLLLVTRDKINTSCLQASAQSPAELTALYNNVIMQLCVPFFITYYVLIYAEKLYTYINHSRKVSTDLKIVNTAMPKFLVHHLYSYLEAIGT